MDLKGKKEINYLTLITKLELGGAQQVALNTLRGLKEEYLKKFLIAGQGGLLDAQAQALSDVEVQLWKSLKHPIRPLADLITFFRLIRFMRRNRIDIVHTHSSKAGLLGRLAAKCAGVPVILHTIHGWPFHPYQSALKRTGYIWLEQIGAKCSTRLIAVSQATQTKGEQHRIGKSEQYKVIVPASDLQNFSPGTASDREALRQEFGFASKALIVGMVACLKPQKAVLDFVSAAKIVLQTCPDTRFLVVGDGQERQAIEAKIQQVGIGEQFKLAGWRTDVAKLMKGFDLLALSSLWEGLPCVLAQAMATGLPIVATRVEGIEEAVQHGKTGVLVLPKQPKQLGQAMVELLQTQEQREQFGQAGLEQASRYSLDTMVQNLLILYKEQYLAQLKKEMD
jgi:glycosyltransferase involved in cell wall biosynthesis